jgi:hypothetical protein
MVKKYECSNCEDGENLAEECTCMDCGRHGSLVTKLQKQEDKQYKILDKILLELSEKDKIKAYRCINEIIELNLEIEGYCNQ